MVKVLTSIFIVTLFGCGPESISRRSTPVVEPRSDDFVEKKLTDCHGRNFDNLSADKPLIPADALYLENYIGQSESLCSLALTSPEEVAVLHFTSRECLGCSQNAVVIGELLAEQELSGSYYEIRGSEERATTPRGNIDTLFDDDNKLRYYFSPASKPSSRSTIVFINSNKQAFVYEAENIETETIREMLAEFVVLVEETDSEEPSIPEIKLPEEEEDLTDEEALALGLANIEKSFIQEKLSYITQDRFEGRLTGTEGNVQVADYIIDHLKEWGIAPAKDGEYRQTFRISNGPTSGGKTANIVAVIPGNHELLKHEYVVIGAHMDHAGSLGLGYTCSRGASGSNQICNGADDNGSGTISVLNIAKALSLAKDNIKRTVVLMWFSGEELGLEGSWHYVSSDPIFPIRKTAYMINLDMVGYMKSYGNKLAALGGGTSSVGSRIISSIDSKYPDRRISITTSAGGGSDHVPFMNAGIPGVFFHTGVSNNANYHRTSDTPDLIDYDGMLVAAKISFETLFRASNEAAIVNYQFHGSREKLTLKSFVSPEELLQTCHHLGLNPHANALAEPAFK